MKPSLLLVLASLILFSACYTPRFANSPTAHNVPVLEKKNDSKLSANYSTNLDIRASEENYNRNRTYGTDIQAAYALTNHVAVQGSYFARREYSYNNFSDNNYFDSSNVDYKRSGFELGLGYFSPISSNNKILFQVFAGIHISSLKMNDKGKEFGGQLYSRYYNADLVKYYFEPAIIFRNKELFAASLSTRFSLVNFRNIKTNYSQPERESLRLDSLNRYATLFFEPAFVNSWGFKNLPGFRIEYQLGLSLIASRYIMDYRTFNFSVGLLFDIPKLIKGPTR